MTSAVTLLISQQQVLRGRQLRESLSVAADTREGRTFRFGPSSFRFGSNLTAPLQHHGGSRFVLASLYCFEYVRCDTAGDV